MISIILDINYFQESPKQWHDRAINYELSFKSHKCFTIHKRQKVLHQLIYCMAKISRTGCCGEYLDQRQRKLIQNGKNLFDEMLHNLYFSLNTVRL
jgi:hypothetical protein